MSKKERVCKECGRTYMDRQNPCSACRRRAYRRVRKLLKYDTCDICGVAVSEGSNLCKTCLYTIFRRTREELSNKNKNVFALDGQRGIPKRYRSRIND